MDIICFQLKIPWVQQTTTFQLFHTYEETRFSRSSRLSLSQTHTVPNGVFLFIKLNIEVNLIVLPEQLIFDSITDFCWSAIGHHVMSILHAAYHHAIQAAMWWILLL